MVVCKQKIIRGTYLFLGLMIVLSFQNCGKSTFLIESLNQETNNNTAAIQIIDADCSSVYGCQSASSGGEAPLPPNNENANNNIPSTPVTGSSTPSSTATVGQSPGKTSTSNSNFTYGMPSVLLSSPALENANSKKLNDLYYNFIADSKELCESHIEQKLGIQSTCYIGAGCGTGCGQPSSSCFSANPDKWGACIQETL